MDRRSFLLGTIGLGVALSGCSNPNQPTLRVRLLKNSVPAQLTNAFRNQLTEFKGANLDFKPEEQLQTLFSALQTWKQQPNAPNPQPFAIPFLNRDDSVPDLVTIGDYWLAAAIQQGLILPLETRDWSQWTQLPDKWRSLVTRSGQGELSKTGKVWAAPYRWGSTIIAYRTDIFRDRNLKPPKDWSDLWREELRGRISLLDQPRETIGLTLKKLGQSYNTANLSSVANLESELRSLDRQAKFYSSDSYLQPLILDDTWVAVGYSTDVLSLMRRNPDIAAVFPASGTALFSDLWVRPATASAQSALITQWINFCWKPEVAPQLSLVSQAASPILSTIDAKTFSEALRSNSILVPDADLLLTKSEFLEPIAAATIEQYRSLWAKIRKTSA